MSTDYSAVIRELQQVLGDARVHDSYHRRFAHATDASYFRIVPEVVAEVDAAAEVGAVLAIARPVARAPSVLPRWTRISARCRR